jgi:hypothetical protein
MKYYIHHVPGRLRVKLQTLRSNPDKSQKIRDLLDLYGIYSVHTNPMTGSTIIKYDTGEIDAGQLLHILKENGYYDGPLTVGSHDPIQKLTDKAAQRVGKAFFGWAVGRALEANGLSIIAAFI